MNNIQSITSQKENIEIEYKTAKGGIPNSMWETVSAFANTNGGVILFGVAEKDKRAVVDGLSEDEVVGLKKKFWDLAHNRQKLNVCFFKEEEVHEEELKDGWVLVIEVIRVDYKLRPIYINGTPYGNTFKRNHEGDYHCTDDEVRQMFSDANLLSSSVDGRILCNYSMDDIDLNTLRKYRKEYDRRHENHPWSQLEDEVFLEKIGAYRKDRRTREEGFTVAGMLMFGKTEAITDQECLPYYFVDYREHLTDDTDMRWTDRIYPDGRWSANLYEYYNRVLNKLYEALPKPFMLDADGKTRLEYTSAHISLREALANSLIHAAYTQMGNVTVDRWKNRIVLSNPGTMLVSVEQFFQGQQSVCRNPLVQNMFVQLGIGEKAGSGADIIVKGWKDNKWALPQIEEKERPDRVVMTMNLDDAKTDINRHQLTSNRQQTANKPTTNRQQTDNKRITNGQQTDNNGQQTENKPLTNHQQTTSKPLTNTNELLVLKSLIEAEKSLKELIDVCGYKDRDSFRQSVLNGMLEKGWVAMTHPENVNHKKQRYVITELGKHLLPGV